MIYKSAQYYDAVYASKNYGLEAERLHELIQLHLGSDGKRLLDVACGTGQHLMFLKRYYDVSGLDINPDFIAIAKRKNPDVRFYVDDMTSFDHQQQYDVVTCMFSAIAYVQTKARLLSTIQNMAKSLRQGGLLIVEPWYSPDAFQPGHFSAKFCDSAEMKVVRMNHWSRENGVSIGLLEYLIVSASGINHITETHKMGLFSNVDYFDTMRSVMGEVMYDPPGLTDKGLYIGVNS